jgi:hypothetical protein
VISLIALICALGSAAAALPGRNSVGSEDIKPNSIRSTDIRHNALTGADVSEATLMTVPKATNAGKLGGVRKRGFLRFGEIPHGQTVRGTFGTAGTTFQRDFVNFPAPAPKDLDDSRVNFTPGEKAGDDDPACTGSPQNPTAPAGKVCLYADGFWAGTEDASCTGESAAPDFSEAGTFRFGFRVEATGAGPMTGCIGNWAYTAP